MNLHQTVRGAIGAVNPDVLGSVLLSTGYTTGGAGKRTPTYDRIDRMPMQIQPLSPMDLKQLDSLNIQGVERAVYINGAPVGVDRRDVKGGDLIEVLGARWLVTVVLEPWDSAGWSKVGVTKQIDPPA